MEFIDALEKIADILNKLKIPYAITGGVAVTVWGRARYTADIDIVIDISSQKLEQLINALLGIEKGIYLDISPDISIETIKQQGGFNLIHSQSGIKADFVIKGSDEFSQLEIKRAVKKNFHNQKIYFISPEDLILIKLLWHKDSGSTRHLEDAESILKITKVDLKYIKQWAKRQSTLKTLNKIINNNR